MLNGAILEFKKSSARSTTLYARVLAMWGQVQSWREIRRQRRALLSLSDSMLKDIGISRADAFHEGNKPFWHP